MKPAKCVIHVNRQRAKQGLPWTIHHRGKCLPASHVRIFVETETCEKPNAPSNPRYFLTCRGVVTFDGTVATIRGAARE